MNGAVEVLQRAAEQRAPGERLAERLADVQALLGPELEALETALREMAAAGTPPADAAAAHLVGRGGKRVRPLALLLANACFGPISPVARELAVVVELVHSATLLHDDVIDDGAERRGAPAARRIWGNGISVLAGDLLLVGALEKTFVHAPELLGDLLATLRRLVDGEIVQLRGRLELDPSIETYERVLSDKTASLFAWASATGARIGRASAEQQRALGSFGEELGVAFQLVDDVLDYESEHTGKTLLGDLTEGKLTLPLVLTVQKQPELAAELARIQSGDLEPLESVSRAVQSSGALPEVRRRAERHTSRAIDALGKVPACAARSLLESVARELADRAR
jgi:octaprenyl-diphosphate synthase